MVCNWNLKAVETEWTLSDDWLKLYLMFRSIGCKSYEMAYRVSCLSSRSNTSVVWFSEEGLTPISCPTKSLHWLLWCRTLLSEEGAPQWRAVSMVTPGCMNGSLGNCGLWHPSILHWHCRTIPIQSSQPSATHLLCELFWVSNCTSNSGCFLSFWEVSKNVSLLEAKACCAF